MADVKRLLVSNRLVTLTGAGSVGKTRLAVRIAADLVSQYAGGVWLVELAELADASLVSDKVALALRLQPRGGRDSQELVREHDPALCCSSSTTASTLSIRPRGLPWGYSKRAQGCASSRPAARRSA